MQNNEVPAAQHGLYDSFGQKRTWHRQADWHRGMLQRQAGKKADMFHGRQARQGKRMAGFFCSFSPLVFTAFFVQFLRSSAAP